MFSRYKTQHTHMVWLRQGTQWAPPLEGERFEEGQAACCNCPHDRTIAKGAQRGGHFSTYQLDD